MLGARCACTAFLECIEGLLQVIAHFFHNQNPFFFAFGNFVQALFHLRGVMHVRKMARAFNEPIGRFATQLGGNQILAFCCNVGPLVQGLQDVRVARRPPHPIFLQVLNQAFFLVAGLGLRLGFLGQSIDELSRSLFRCKLTTGLGFFLRNGSPPRKVPNRQRCFELELGIRILHGCHRDVVRARRRLAAQEHFTNRIVEHPRIDVVHRLVFFHRYLGRRVFHMGWSNGFVRVLGRVFILETVGLVRDHVHTIVGSQIRSCFLLRFVSNAHRVGSHVRDKSVFKELLRNLHRLLAAPAKTPRTQLLQGGRNEWRLGVDNRLVRINVHHCPLIVRDVFERLNQTINRLGADKPFLALFAARLLCLASFFRVAFQRLCVIEYSCRTKQVRFEFNRLLRERTFDRVAVFRPEFFMLPIALNNHAKGCRLNPAGTLSIIDCPHQHGRNAIAHHAVKNASCTLCTYPILVNFTPRLHRPLQPLGSDFVELNAVVVVLLQLEQVVHVPGNSLPFAVGVGSNDDTIRLFGKFLDLLDEVRVIQPAFALQNNVAFLHGGQIHAQFLGWQIHHVAKRSLNNVICPQKALQLFRFGWRFHQQ